MAVLAVCDTQREFFVFQGLLWLLLATLAEVPSAVRLVIFLRPFFCSSLLRVTGTHDFESEW